MADLTAFKNIGLEHLNQERDMSVGYKVPHTSNSSMENSQLLIGASIVL